MVTTTRTIAIPQQLDPVTVLGPVDEVLREVERAFPDLTIIVRGNRIAIMSRSSKSESQAAQAEHVIETSSKPHIRLRWTPIRCDACSIKTC